MKVTSPPVIITLKVIFILGGFTIALIGNQIDKHQESPTILVAIISSVVTLLLVPYVIVLLVRLNVAIGFYKPPWEPPTLSSNPFDYRNPLLFFHFASFVFVAFGIGAMISIPWNGLVGVSLALIGFSGGVACYLGLIRLMKLYPPLQNNSQVQ